MIKPAAGSRPGVAESPRSGGWRAPGRPREVLERFECGSSNNCEYNDSTRTCARARGPVPPHPQSTADQEETPPKSAPARKKGLEVLGCAAQDERETYVTKAPKTITCAPGSHAIDPATCTDRT